MIKCDSLKKPIWKRYLFTQMNYKFAKWDIIQFHYLKKGYSIKVKEHLLLIFLTSTVSLKMRRIFSLINYDIPSFQMDSLVSLPKPCINWLSVARESYNDNMTMKLKRSNSLPDEWNIGTNITAWGDLWSRTMPLKAGLWQKRDAVTCLFGCLIKRTSGEYQRVFKYTSLKEGYNHFKYTRRNNISREELTII